jgi:multidrug resistance efflux pump
VILQREQDLRVARATEENARATVDVYREIIDQRKAEYGQAEATRDYRAKRYARFTKLAAGGGIQEGIVEEEQRDYLSADYGGISQLRYLRCFLVPLLA